MSKVFSNDDIQKFAYEHQSIPEWIFIDSKNNLTTIGKSLSLLKDSDQVNIIKFRIDEILRGMETLGYLDLKQISTYSENYYSKLLNLLLYYNPKFFTNTYFLLDMLKLFNKSNDEITIDKKKIILGVKKQIEEFRSLYEERKKMESLKLPPLSEAAEKCKTIEMKLKYIVSCKDFRITSIFENLEVDDYIPFAYVNVPQSSPLIKVKHEFPKFEINEKSFKKDKLYFLLWSKRKSDDAKSEEQKPSITDSKNYMLVSLSILQSNDLAQRVASMEAGAQRVPTDAKKTKETLAVMYFSLFREKRGNWEPEEWKTYIEKKIIPKFNGSIRDIKSDTILDITGEGYFIMDSLQMIYLRYAMMIDKLLLSNMILMEKSSGTRSEESSIRSIEHYIQLYYSIEPLKGQDLDVKKMINLPLVRFIPERVFRRDLKNMKAEVNDPYYKIRIYHVNQDSLEIIYNGILKLLNYFKTNFSSFKTQFDSSPYTKKAFPSKNSLENAIASSQEPIRADTTKELLKYSGFEHLFGPQTGYSRYICQSGFQPSRLDEQNEEEDYIHTLRFPNYQEAKSDNSDVRVYMCPNPKNKIKELKYIGLKKSKSGLYRYYPCCYKTKNEELNKAYSKGDYEYIQKLESKAAKKLDFFEDYIKRTPKQLQKDELGNLVKDIENILILINPNFSYQRLGFSLEKDSILYLISHLIGQDYTQVKNNLLSFLETNKQRISNCGQSIEKLTEGWKAYDLYPWLCECFKKRFVFFTLDNRTPIIKASILNPAIKWQNIQNNYDIVYIVENYGTEINVGYATYELITMINYNTKSISTSLSKDKYPDSYKSVLDILEKSWRISFLENEFLPGKSLSKIKSIVVDEHSIVRVINYSDIQLQVKNVLLPILNVPITDKFTITNNIKNVNKFISNLDIEYQYSQILDKTFVSIIIINSPFSIPVKYKPVGEKEKSTDCIIKYSISSKDSKNYWMDTFKFLYIQSKLWKEYIGHTIMNSDVFKNLVPSDLKSIEFNNIVNKIDQIFSDRYSSIDPTIEIPQTQIIDINSVKRNGKIIFPSQEIRNRLKHLFIFWCIHQPEYLFILKNQNVYSQYHSNYQKEFNIFKSIKEYNNFDSEYSQIKIYEEIKLTPSNDPYFLLFNNIVYLFQPCDSLQDAMSIGYEWIQNRVNKLSNNPKALNYDSIVFYYNYVSKDIYEIQDNSTDNEPIQIIQYLFNFKDKKYEKFGVLLLSH